MVYARIIGHSFQEGMDDVPSRVLSSFKPACNAPSGRVGLFASLFFEALDVVRRAPRRGELLAERLVRLMYANQLHHVAKSCGVALPTSVAQAWGGHDEDLVDCFRHLLGVGIRNRPRIAKLPERTP